MSLEDIRKMDTTEINKKIVDVKNELFDLRRKQCTGTLRETHKIQE